METTKNYNEVTYKVIDYGLDFKIKFSNGIQIYIPCPYINEEDFESPDDYADAWSKLIIEKVQEYDADFAQFLRDNDSYTRSILEV